MNSTILYMNLAIIAITAICFVYFVGKAKRKEDPKAQAKADAKAIRHYDFYNRFPITRSIFQECNRSLSMFGIANEDEFKIQAAQTFEKGLYPVLGIIVIGSVYVKNPLFIALFILFGYVYIQEAIVKKSDAIYNSVCAELSESIAIYRQAYIPCKDIRKAFIGLKLPPRMKAPFKRIQQIIDGGTEEDLREFVASFPMPLICTLASTLFINANTGGDDNNQGGDSLSDVLLVIQQECDGEIRNNLRIRIAFKSMPLLVLAALLIWPVAEIFMRMQIPGLVVLFDGMYGQILRVVQVLSVILIYSNISKKQRASIVNSSDVNVYIAALVDVPIIANITKNLMPKSRDKREKLSVKIKDAISQMTIKYVYTAKLVYFVGGFVIGMVALFCSMWAIKSSFANNYNSLSLIPSSLSKTQEIQVKILDDRFLTISKSEYQAYLDDMPGFATLVKSSISGLSEMQVNDQVDRLQQKYEIYHSAVPAWWWPLVALVVAIICWFLPDIQLSMRIKALKAEQEYEVGQLETMAIVLSHTTFSCEKVLIYLELQSRLFKKAFRTCLSMYKADPKAAIDSLFIHSTSKTFERICRKLYDCVYDVSVADAFKDMPLQKQQSLGVTEMLKTESIELRKNSAKLLSILPAGIALVGWFIAPVLILGLGQMGDVMSGLG